MKFFRKRQSRVEYQDVSPFTYRALDTSKNYIRLVNVVRRKRGDHLQCQIVHADLKDDPNFIALSYTWDEAGTPSKTISCEGYSMKIGMNLWNFLDRYSSDREQSHTSLWIDAMCIDQSNLKERNHQVSQMRTIYTKAQGVIAWLGEATESDKLAFHGLKHPRQLHQDQYQKAMLGLCQKRYFLRIWVVQEFVLAQDVQLWCGNLSANVQDFDYGWPYQLREQAKAAEGSAMEIIRYRGLWHNTWSISISPFGLHSLICAFSESNCSLLHDRVYGMLGLASASGLDTAQINPDYSMSTTNLLLDVLRYEKDASVHDLGLSLGLLSDRLKNMFNVSSWHLATTLLAQYPSLEPRIYSLFENDEITAPLHFYDHVVLFDFPAGDAPDPPNGRRPVRFAQALGPAVANSSHPCQERVVNVNLLQNMHNHYWQQKARNMVNDTKHAKRDMLEILLGFTRAQLCSGHEANSHDTIDLHAARTSISRSLELSVLDSSANEQSYIDLTEDVFRFETASGLQGIVTHSSPFWKKQLYVPDDVVQIWTLEKDNIDSGGFIVLKEVGEKWSIIGVTRFTGDTFSRVQTKPDEGNTGTMCLQGSLLDLLKLYCYEVISGDQLKDMINHWVPDPAAGRSR